MFGVLTLYRVLLAWARGLRASRDAEILFLRQQLLVVPIGNVIRAGSCGRVM